jgi:hypothetical protein
VFVLFVAFATLLAAQLDRVAERPRELAALDDPAIRSGAHVHHLRAP